MMCRIMTAHEGSVQVGDTQSAGADLAIAVACNAAGVTYEDFTLTIAAGGYPCLPGVAAGATRSFDETDLLALYIYGRLRAFGFGALRAGEYACRVHAALRSHAQARAVSIDLTGDGGKRVLVDCATPALPATMLLGKLEFDIPAIREFLKTRIDTGSKVDPV
jgi:hypothetical protein